MTEHDGAPHNPPPLGDAGAGEHSPEKKEEKTKKKKEKKGTRLAPLPVSEDVIGYLNEQAGSNQRPNAEAHRALIQARLDSGATVDDLKTVIRKKCAEWAGTGLAGNLKPSCLFRASNFDGYLGQPESTGQRSMSYGPTPQHMQQDYTPQKRDDGNDF